MFTSYLSPFVIACAVCLVLGFSRVHVGGKLARIVEMVVPLSFSAYLIQDNEVVRTHLIKGAFTWIAELGPVLIVAVTVGLAVLSFLAFAALDTPREWLFARLGIAKRLRALEDSLRRCMAPDA